ncbi:dentin sialophosphoprotein-like [Dorcoceras hygrometricum]|uniref:Dentin sialophosphoprotein-like n=1 Tax=Dorcoceras hygrometricum TaxID=472368 RepID=A0A2Z7D3V4_9LAMI|nr:dentin sialophosphoprotein-like [Dorcoceras hygrometricum]
MATRTKDSAPAREKRGTSPSNSPQTGTATQRRSRPSPSKTSSPAKSQDSTTSEKQIPNYLKPTISSANDTPKQQGKKPIAVETVHKPSLSRRRSFDRPPSASSTQKARISPNPTLRSSSFSSKTSTTQKPKDAGKHSSLYARPISTVKKSGTYVKKQDTGSGTALVKEQVTSPSEIMEASDASVIPQPEVKQEVEESAVAKVEEEAPQIKSNNEMGTEILVQEESEPIKEEKGEDVKVETEAVDAISEQDDASLAIKTEEEPEGESHIEETGSKHQELEEHGSNKCDNNQNEERVSDIPIAEVEEKDEEHGQKDGEHGEYLDEKEVEASGNETTESKEMEVQEIRVEEKQEEDVAVKQQVPQGKKDSAVSNDVIEETASKLREQRKNKVKALAGAFETVISLQEPK